MDYQGATIASKVQMWSAHVKCELNKCAAPLEVTKNDQVMKIDASSIGVHQSTMQMSGTHSRVAIEPVFSS